VTISTQIALIVCATMIAMKVIDKFPSKKHECRCNKKEGSDVRS